MSSPRVNRRLRRAVIRRAAGGCEFCRFPAAYTNAPFHCEHVRPRDAGGETVFSNLAWVCPWCNAHKYSKTDGRDPQTGRRVALFNPRRQRWARHFAWSDNLLLIVGRTAIGRATVQELNLNRQEVVRLRRLLLAAGEHPPASG